MWTNRSVEFKISAIWLDGTVLALATRTKTQYLCWNDCATEWDGSCYVKVWDLALALAMSLCPLCAGCRCYSYLTAQFTGVKAWQAAQEKEKEENINFGMSVTTSHPTSLVPRPILSHSQSCTISFLDQYSIFHFIMGMWPCLRYLSKSLGLKLVHTWVSETIAHRERTCLCSVLLCRGAVQLHGP